LSKNDKEIIMKRNLSAGYTSIKGASFEVLSDDDLHQIHLGTLEILEHTGLKVASEEAMDYFGKGGAQVDRGAKIVKLPAYMVEEAIISAPPSVFLAGQKPEYDIILETGRVHFCPFGQGIAFVDPDTGVVRPSTKKDAEDCARIVDYLDEYDFCFDTLAPRDKPNATTFLHSTEALLTNTFKPVITGPTSTRTTELLIEMAAAVAGGLDNLKRRPIIMNSSCPISPMVLTHELCESIITSAKNKIPFMVLSMAMAGGMAPVTLAGSIVVMNAEMMGSLVLSQLVNKGTPFVYGTSSGLTDMRHNAGAMVGCPELALLSAAVAAICRKKYHIPSFVAGA
jgi:trimethylamine--corrinoid protein Co-methyltransferase